MVPASADSAWKGALSEVMHHDFHHLPGYHRLAEERGEGGGLLFTYREGGYLIGLPLLLRAIDHALPDGWSDATSVYGYGGPVASHEQMPRPVIDRFQHALRSELEARRVVAVFSRLHPLIPQEHLLIGLGEVAALGLTVSVDLTLPLAEQWAGYSKKCRRAISKAREAGVVCIHDRERRYRDQWVEIYQETMRRVNAPRSYFLDDSYFERLAQELGDILNLFVALVGDQVVAAGLYTICDGIAQAHLGGMRTEFGKISPSRILDDTARIWAFERGARVFHLGGGVGGREDSLFRYKAGFSARRHRFSTWKWIVDPHAYRLLVAKRAVHDQPLSDYFPAYREAPAPLRPEVS